MTSFISCNRIGVLCSTLALLLASHIVVAEEAEHLDYDHQATWQAVHGDMQSPINIDPAKVKLDIDDDDDDNIQIRKMPLNATVIDNGHAIQLNMSQGDSAKIRGRRFQLLQFHFHAQSEHTIDGKHFPLEGHFVFKSKDGRLAVIGVMFQEGKENRAFGDILQHIVRNGSAPISMVDIGKLFPLNKSYYHYLGSLTTPPLSENVEWYLLDHPMELSTAQIDSFKTYYSHNNRDIQPLDGRELLHYIASKKTQNKKK